MLSFLPITTNVEFTVQLSFDNKFFNFKSNNSKKKMFLLIILITQSKISLAQNSSESPLNVSYTCPPVQSYSKNSFSPNYHIVVNNISENVLTLHECDEDHKFRGEYVIRCSHERTWIKEMTRHSNPLQKISFDCLSKDYRHLLLCFNSNVLQSCDGGSNDFKESHIFVLVIVLLVFVTIAMAILVVKCYLRSRRRKASVMASFRSGASRTDSENKYYSICDDYDYGEKTYLEILQ